MKMISNRDACNWCGRVIELVEGKKYCDECCCCCKCECRTCHKPYSSLKYFPNSDAEGCNSCTKRNEKRKTKYTKNEAIAMLTKNRKRRDDEGRVDGKMLERSTTPPPSPSKKKRRTILHWTIFLTVAVPPHQITRYLTMKVLKKSTY